MSLFGKTDDSASREMIRMQKEQADENRRKEAQRKARIEQGLTRIKQQFHGGAPSDPKQVAKTFNVTGPATGTVAGTAVSGLPAGYTYVQQAAPTTPAKITTPGKPGTPATTTNVPAGAHPGDWVPISPGSKQLVKVPGGPNTAPSNTKRLTDLYGHDAGPGLTTGPATTSGTPAAPKVWFVKGPDGKLHAIGSKIGYQDTVMTGKTADPQKTFLEKYRQGYEGNYLPQVATKFKDARDATTYALADAGTLRSSMANEEGARLAKQNLLNEADVRNKATEAVGSLQDRLNQEEAKANAQVLANEDPDVAASQATRAVANITAEKPSNTPLGDIFDLAAIGGAKYLQGAQNASMRSKYVPGAQSGGRIV
jgi:hypothetical protein